MFIYKTGDEGIALVGLGMDINKPCLRVSLQIKLSKQTV